MYDDLVKGSTKEILDLARTNQPIEVQVLQGTTRYNALDALARKLADSWYDANLFKSCINCDHWQDDKQLCGLYSMLPPAKVIVTGCDKHTDLIPF